MLRPKKIIKFFQNISSQKGNLNYFHFFTTSSKFVSTAKTSSNNTKHKESNETLIYEYKNVDHKLRSFFWGNMLYIYGNSLLFHFELLEPTIGYFHGLMLTMSLAVGWSCFFVVGSIAHKTVFRIYKFNDYLGRTKYRIVYLSYYKVIF